MPEKIFGIRDIVPNNIRDNVPNTSLPACFSSHLRRINQLSNSSQTFPLVHILFWSQQLEQHYWTAVVLDSLLLQSPRNWSTTFPVDHHHRIRYQVLFFFGIRYIVSDIGKYEFLLGAMYLIPKFYPCIYIQIGIDWNQFPAGKRIDSDQYRSLNHSR